jgi:dethiobiotin synthetase
MVRQAEQKMSYAVPMQPIFVTGADTGVGKTMIAAHLLKQLRAASFDAGYWKPIETGVPDGQPQDAAFVQQVAGDDAPALCSVALPEPLAPSVAARRAGCKIDVAHLKETAERLARMYRPLIVEGAGGLLVHINDQLTFADLVKPWGVRVLLVVGNKLGCLNHAELTYNEIKRRDLEWGGWVLNDIEAQASLAAQTNLGELIKILGEPLAVVPYGGVASVSLLGR